MVLHKLLSVQEVYQSLFVYSTCMWSCILWSSTLLFLSNLTSIFPSLLSPCLAQLCDVMVREVCEGVEGTGVRCGVIGEVGVSYPMTNFEKKSLQASAKAQQITGTYLAIYKCTCRM